MRTVGSVPPGTLIAVLPKPVPSASVCLSQSVVAFAAEIQTDSRPLEAEIVIYPTMFAGSAAAGASGCVAGIHQL